MPFDGIEDFANRELMLDKLNEVTVLLSEDGKWCKGQLRTSDGRHCIMGALITTNSEALLHDVVAASARDVTGIFFRRVEHFNDSPATDHNLVLAVLDQTRYRILSGNIPGPAASDVYGLARLYRWFRLSLT